LAQSLYERALALARRTGDQRGINRELGNLGVVFHAQGQYQKAEQFMRDALASCLGSTQCIAQDEGNLGNVLLEQGELVQALGLYQDSFARAQEIGSAYGQALALQAIAIALTEQGELAAAVRNYDQALGLLRKIGQKSDYAQTLESLGRTQAYQGDTDAARRTFGDVLSIQSQLKEKGNLAQTQLALAELLCDTQQASQASGLIRTALKEFQIENKNTDEIRAQVVLARSLRLEGQIPAARSAIDAAQALAQPGSTTDRLEWQIEEARVRAAEKDFSGAEYAAREVLAQADRRGLVRLQLQASLTLAEVHAAGADSTGVRAEVQRVQRAAQSKGFGLMARQAAALAARPAPR